jgi:hypothetical protein
VSGGNWSGWAFNGGKSLANDKRGRNFGSLQYMNQGEVFWGHMGGGLGRYLSASRLRQCGRRSEAVIRSDLSQFGTNQVKPRTFERETGPFLNFFMSRIRFSAFIEVQGRKSQSLLFLDLIPRSQVFWSRVLRKGW